MPQRNDSRGPVEPLLEVLAQLAASTSSGRVTATNAQLCIELGKHASRSNGTATQVARALRTARAEGRIRVTWPAPGQRGRGKQPPTSGRVIEVL